MILVKPLQCEWSYLQRVIPNCADVFSPLNDVINKFWPAVFLGSTSATEMSLFSLPTIVRWLSEIIVTKWIKVPFLA